MKIRLKLTLWFTALVAFILASGSLLGWVGLRSYLQHQAESELHDKTLEIESFFETLASAAKPKQVDLGRYLTQLEAIFASDQQALFDDLLIQLTDKSGKIISRSSHLETLGSLPLFPPERRVHIYALKQAETGRVFRVLYSNTALIVNGQKRGELQLGLTLQKTEELLNQLLWLEGLVILVSILLAAILGQFLAQRALQPMIEITQQVQEMAGEDLFRPLDLSPLNRDEIGMLAETFNELMKRIEAVFMAQGRFLADASHEFKTPLTAIRGHAQLIAKRGERSDIRLQSSQVIQRESERLNRLVEDLLLLSRLEGQSTQNRPVDLHLLCAEIYEDLSDLHPELEFEGHDQAIWIQGQADSLRQILLNLISNALRALEQPGKVTLSCRIQGKEAALTVRDTGVGIAAEHLPHLFKRFYRVDNARSRQSDGGGTGIGLALVYEIVRHHQGQIQVHSELGSGTVFTVTFPLRSNPKS